jgi:hypothetical protein
MTTQDKDERVINSGSVTYSIKEAEIDMQDPEFKKMGKTFVS